MFVKRFFEWVRVARTVDARDHTPPLVKEGELWWCIVGENIGVEISGKGQYFTRPVIILKRFGKLSFYGIPTTTKAKSGSWYVPFTVSGTEEIAIISQARTYSYKRLGERIGSLDKDEYKKIKEAFISLFY